MIENRHATSIDKVKLVQPVSGRHSNVYKCYEKIHIVQNKREKSLMNMNDDSVSSILFALI